MKTLELEKYGVFQLSSSETQEMSGGNPIILGVVGSLIAAAIYDFSNGMYDEYKSRQNKTPVRGAGGSY